MRSGRKVGNEKQKVGKDKRYLRKILALYYMYAVTQLVEALRYKPEGRGIDSLMSLEFFIDIILPAALWHWC
jgi:hypothetical protein